MSTPRTPRRPTREPEPREPSAAQPTPIGAGLVALLDVAYRARLPVLLEGPTGIGKSQIVAQFAQSAGIQCVVLDLSLLEPPDLVGLPVIRDGRTHYASPAELPTEGRGVLMLEELNRAEVLVMQPALQLLSARRLHSYELPPGWFCVAAVNPEDGDYQVNRLDPALRARFMQLAVCADRDAWLDWATSRNVHPAVLSVVREHATVFDDASPRSWAYVSDLLRTLRPDELARRELVVAALRGYLPSAWATLVAGALTRDVATPSFDPAAALTPGGERAFAAMVYGLVAEGRIDAIATVASRLRAFLASDTATAMAVRGALSFAVLEQMSTSLPGDLREQCLEGAAESPAAEVLLKPLGIDAERVVSLGYEATSARIHVRAWVADKLHHRVRLAVVAIHRALQRSGPASLALDSARRRQLRLLVDDAGDEARDLAQWLRSHGLLDGAPGSR